MKILIACEYSGIVRDAFARLGHDVTSCDLLPTERIGKHYQGDVRDILNDGWDLMIAHPPCTHLAVSGARWFKDKEAEQLEALEFVRTLLNAPIDKIALENPISVISSKIRKPDQIIQPWMFGHGETKATCLWLKNLPKLEPTNIVAGREGKVWRMPPGKDRWKLRSTTYQGIADAMSQQWVTDLVTAKPLATTDVVYPPKSAPTKALREALKKDFRTLYIKEFMAEWKPQRLVRELEIDVMELENLQALITSKVASELEDLKTVVRHMGQLGFPTVESEIDDRINTLKEQEGEHGDSK